MPTNHQAENFCRDIEEKSRQSIRSCYQCVKCAGSCPVNSAMTHSNYEILRLIQLGEKEEVLASNTPWLCVSCKTCAARCPNGIDTASILDVVKMEAVKAPVSRGDSKTIKTFYELFLRNVRGWPVLGGEGRAYELGLLGLYKLRTGTYFADLGLGLKFMKRGKLAFLPRNALRKRRGEIRKIFALAKEKRGK